VRRDRTLAKECQGKIVEIIVARMRTKILKTNPEFEVERLPAFAENMIAKAGWNDTGVIARCCRQDGCGVIDDEMARSAAFVLMEERAVGLYLHFLRTQDKQAEARARLLSRAVPASTYQKIEEVARARLDEIIQEEEARAEEARKVAAAQAAIPKGKLVSAAQAAGVGGWGSEKPVRGVSASKSRKNGGKKGKKGKKG